MELTEIEWLPEPTVVMNRSIAAAATDALLSPDPDLRQYYSKANWKDGLSMAWRHDGAGSYYYVLKSGDSMAIKVCKARMSLAPDPLARLQRNPIETFSPLATQILNEPEFRYQELSFLAFSEGGGPWQSLQFRVDNIPSNEMGQSTLDLICKGPKIFYLYGQSFHEVTLDPPALKAMFALEPMTASLASTIAPDANLAEVRAELEEIGYPIE